MTVSGRRRARRLAYLNGAVWAIGNGLASSTLVVYLALELGAPRIGIWISLILAAPRIAGLLRLAAPVLIGRFADRKRFCLYMYLASAAVLLGLPVVAAPGRLPSAAASLAALVSLWSAYHLLEYLGTVALWSWLADLVPLEIRGRFFGRRERWMVSGQLVAMLLAGLFSYVWKAYLAPPGLEWVGYAIPAGAGAGCMMAAIVPLARMPGITAGANLPAAPGTARAPRAVTRSVVPGSEWSLRAIVAPFRDRRFLRLVLFGCWFSFFNGVTQSA